MKRPEPAGSRAGQATGRLLSITGAPLRVNPADAVDTSGSSEGAAGGFQMVPVNPVYHGGGGGAPGGFPPGGSASAAAVDPNDPAVVNFLAQEFHIQQEEYNIHHQQVLLLEENQQLLVQQNLVVNDPALMEELDRRGQAAAVANARAHAAL